MMTSVNPIFHDVYSDKETPKHYMWGARQGQSDRQVAVRETTFNRVFLKSCLIFQSASPVALCKADTSNTANTDRFGVCNSLSGKYRSHCNLDDFDSKLTDESLFSRFVLGACFIAVLAVASLGV
jgi:hypothetical protein